MTGEFKYWWNYKGKDILYNIPAYHDIVHHVVAYKEVVTGTGNFKGWPFTFCVNYVELWDKMMYGCLN